MPERGARIALSKPNIFFAVTTLAPTASLHPHAFQPPSESKPVVTVNFGWSFYSEHTSSGTHRFNPSLFRSLLKFPFICSLSGYPDIAALSFSGSLIQLPFLSQHLAPPDIYLFIYCLFSLLLFGSPTICECWAIWKFHDSLACLHFSSLNLSLRGVSILFTHHVLNFFLAFFWFFEHI